MKHRFMKRGLIFVLLFALVFSSTSFALAAEHSVTWNPNDMSSNVILSNNNLTAQLSTKAYSTGNYLRATEGKSTGKWYWEIIIDHTTDGGCFIGVSSANTKTDSKEGVKIYSNTGKIYIGAQKSGKTCGALRSGDILSFTLDADNKSLAIYKNGSLLQSGIDISFIPHPIYPFICGADQWGGQKSTITANFGASTFKYPVPEGYLPYNELQNPTLTVTASPNKVSVNQEFTTDIAIHNGTNICAEDIKVKYNPDLFEYKGVQAQTGLKIFKEDESTPGTLRFIIACQGKDNAATGDKDLFNLIFDAKRAGTGKVDIIAGRIADNATLEEDITEENCGEDTITVEEANDVNRSGEYTLLDLGIDAWYDGMNVSETDTTKYNTDVVADGIIDDKDLTEITNQILANDNYGPNK
jgi:hypothetical protein